MMSWDVLHEEASEDMARMAGAPDIEVSEASPVKIARMRLPWVNDNPVYRHGHQRYYPKTDRLY